MSKLSLNPEAPKVVTEEPKSADPPKLAPNLSASSAICLLSRDFVPSRSICAVTLASPATFSGSYKAPAALICS